MPKYIDVEKLEEYKASDVSELMPWQQGWNDAIDTIMDEVPAVDTDKLVNLLNQLIEEAVEDGGDAGGAYNQNQEGLTNAINNILDYLELSDYEVVGTNNYSNWSRIKIGIKGEGH